MTGFLSLFVVLIGIFGHGKALVCFQKSSSTDMSNGSTAECTSTSCYSYMSGTAVSNGCSCPSHTDPCGSCSTDNCNSRTPSSISCFVGSSSTSMSYNGSTVSCPTVFKSCYSIAYYAHMMYPTKFASGCGSCVDISDPSDKRNCAECSTDNCNAPSAASPISCYSSASTVLDPSPITKLCPALLKNCYSILRYPYWFAGCGDCRTDHEIYSPSCVLCTGDNCNALTPSSISCFYRRNVARDGREENGIEIKCHKGINSCYSTNHYSLSASHSFGGCGSCNSSSDLSCITCSTDKCNTVYPASIGCYSRHGFRHRYYGSGERNICPTGITTCYSRVTSDGIYYGDCGRCSGAYQNCTTCSTNYCNTIDISTIVTATTSAPISPSVIKCHNRSGSYVNEQDSCSSSTSCYVYQSTDGDVTTSRRGCGSCPVRCSCSKCQVCYSDFCNSGSVSKASVKLLVLLVLHQLGSMIYN